MIEHEELLKKIAINIRNARFLQKLSQEDLAEKSGLSVNFISNIENAKQDVRLSSLVALANALSKDFSELFK